MTMESLPPEKSSTGRSHSAATSRMMWMPSASSQASDSERVSASGSVWSGAVVLLAIGISG